MLKKISKKILMLLLCLSLLGFNSVTAFASTTSTSIKADSTLKASAQSASWEYLFQRQFDYTGGTPNMSPVYVGGNGQGILFWSISTWWGSQFMSIDPSYTYRVDIAYNYGGGLRGYNSLTGVENLSMAVIAYLPATTTNANFMVYRMPK